MSRNGWMFLSLVGFLFFTGSIFAVESDIKSDDMELEKDYFVLERNGVRAVLINNEAADDGVLTEHKQGYSGVALLTHESNKKNMFVPYYAGLNYEHIFDGTNQSRDILFEPRRAAMDIEKVDKYTVRLHQPATPFWKLESWLTYQMLEDGTLEMVFECVPNERIFKKGYVGFFFASYINQPESLNIHFLGYDKNKVKGSEARWIEGVTPKHGELATHRGFNDKTDFPYDEDFWLTLVTGESNYVYAEPWYYAVNDGMALVQIFRPQDNVRFSQSPTGGGKGNPAWDFQWFIPQYEVGKKYKFKMRAMYLPFKSREQIIQTTLAHRKALSNCK